MKTMIIGLGPDYNYDITDHSIWSKDSTKYSSNHGASLISRTLIGYFNGDYIDDFNPVDDYKKKYGLCVIAFATHITNKRDVSRYANFVRELGIRTVAFSLGIQDYSGSSAAVGMIHPSLRSLLDYVMDSSGMVGVRGPFTASVLIKNGYPAQKIFEVGCPTLYRNLNPDHKIHKPDHFSNPLVVYHRTMAGLNKSILGDAPLLGQDFLDEVVFDSSISDDHVIKKNELIEYSKLKNGDFALSQINNTGIFHGTFQEWWDQIGKADFVVGARLHGCIAALLRGIPAVMIARDIRVKEISTLYQIPCLMFEDVKELTIKEIYDLADFSRFNDLYHLRYQNFMQLLNDLNIAEYLSFDIEPTEIHSSNFHDYNEHLNIIYSELFQMDDKMDHFEKQLTVAKATNSKIMKLFKKLKKLPGSSILKGFVK
jgi:Polysaccharide pyruvyl transferase